MIEVELPTLARRFETLAPVEAARASIAWAVERFGDELAVASSFQDVALVDLVRRAKPDAEIVFLDTGFHFPETLAFVERCRKIWDLNLLVVHPTVGLDQFPCGSPECCQVRKVEPLARALEGRAAWVTGLKRVDTPERSGAPVVVWDAARDMVKVNPLATWTDDDVDGYVESEGLPRHPLTYMGYVSIGCAPTTRPVVEGQNPREGRWPGTGKTECGLHV